MCQKKVNKVVNVNEDVNKEDLGNQIEGKEKVASKILFKGEKNVNKDQGNNIEPNDSGKNENLKPTAPYDEINDKALKEVLEEEAKEKDLSNPSLKETKKNVFPPISNSLTSKMKLNEGLPKLNAFGLKNNLSKLQGKPNPDKEDSYFAVESPDVDQDKKKTAPFAEMEGLNEALKDNSSEENNDEKDIKENKVDSDEERRMKLRLILRCESVNNLQSETTIAAPSQRGLLTSKLGNSDEEVEKQEPKKKLSVKIKDFFLRLKNLGMLYWFMTIAYSCCMNMIYFVNFQIFQLVMIKKLDVPLDQAKSIMAFYPIASIGIMFVSGCLIHRFANRTKIFIAMGVILISAISMLLAYTTKESIILKIIPYFM